MPLRLLTPVHVEEDQDVPADHVGRQFERRSEDASHAGWNAGDFLQDSDKSPLENPGWDDTGEDDLVSRFGMATAGRDVQPVSDEGATGADCR